ncbi:MAG: AbrB/MazE/SpoVT family DNA-binding domain-containing protein [Candidatus Micrarchaeota archaeon]
MAYVTVNTNGQVTIPSDLRKKSRITPGGLVEVTGTDDGILLKPAIVVSKDELASLRKLTLRNNISKAQLVSACREIGEAVYSEEFE